MVKVFGNIVQQALAFIHPVKTIWNMGTETVT